MPINFFQCQNTGTWQADELGPYFPRVPHALGNFRYEFYLWYPRVVLQSVPDVISRKLSSFGNKYYLGEIAFQNFGFIHTVEYLNYQEQQFPLQIAFPAPVFESSNSNEGSFISYNNFQINYPRTNSLSWDLREGVSFVLQIVWLKGSYVYNDEFSFLRVI